MKRETVERLSKDKQFRVIDMLGRHLPKMQPSALKHEYLTTVANVMNHPITTETDEKTGVHHRIGYGDMFRTLPLVLIQEPEPDGTIRHAFVPNPANQRDRRLLDALQRHENDWAQDRGICHSNDIIAQIRMRGRGDVNRHGLNRYTPNPFTHDDMRELIRGGWYDTGYIEPGHEIDHQGPPDIDAHRHTGDAQTMVNNLLKSIEFATQRRYTAPRSLSILPTKTGTVRVDDIEFDESSDQFEP